MSYMLIYIVWSNLNLQFHILFRVSIHLLCELQNSQEKEYNQVLTSLIFLHFSPHLLVPLVQDRQRKGPKSDLIPWGVYWMAMGKMICLFLCIAGSVLFRSPKSLVRTAYVGIHGRVDLSYSKQKEAGLTMLLSSHVWGIHC